MSIDLEMDNIKKEIDLKIEQRNLYVDNINLEIKKLRNDLKKLKEFKEINGCNLEKIKYEEIEKNIDFHYSSEDIQFLTRRVFGSYIDDCVYDLFFDLTIFTLKKMISTNKDIHRIQRNIDITIMSQYHKNKDIAAKFDISSNRVAQIVKDSIRRMKFVYLWMPSCFREEIKQKQRAIMDKRKYQNLILI